MSAHDNQSVGVLLMAYGTPNTPEEIEPYYTDIRGGRKPSPELLAELTERYQMVGGRTPLLEISRAQADGLQRLLDAESPGQYRVYLGMKHWHPYIEAAIRQMRADGVERALAIALAPHYSRMSIGQYIERIESAQGKIAEERANGEPATAPIRFTYVESWAVEPAFLEALAGQVRAAVHDKFSADERDRVFVLFTAHSLPQRIKTWDDPYERELLATSRGVAELMSLAEGRWDFAFQSAGRTPEPWLGPDILDKTRELVGRGERAILVCPVGFIAEHLEIFYDIDVEARQLADELGVHLERIEMLNATPPLVESLAAVVRRQSV